MIQCNVIYAVLLVLCCDANLPSKDPAKTPLPPNEVNIWFNMGALVVLMVLFLLSVRFSAKCSRRRKKMHRGLRLQSPSPSLKSIDLQHTIPMTTPTLKDLPSGPSQFGDDDYADVDEESIRSAHTLTPTSGGLVGTGKTMMNHISSIMSESHCQVIEDMLGMHNDSQSVSRLNDCEYQPI